MNIPLNVLIDAEQALSKLITATRDHLTLEQWTEAAIAHGKLQGHLIVLTRQINVEVEAA